MHTPRRKISLRAILILVTGICAISALLPMTGVFLFAFSGAILGLLMVRDAVKRDDDAHITHGIVVFVVGYIAAALLLGVFAKVMGW